MGVQDQGLGVTLAELWSALGPFLESVRPWISPVALTGILGIVLSHRLGLLKVKVEADRVEVQAREVDHKDDADIRDHYADEVAALRKRLDEKSDEHRRILREAEDRHDQCKRERDELRDDSRKLKDIVAGLIRIITQASASKAILLDGAASAYVRDAALRIDMLFAPRDDEEGKET